MSHEAMTAYGPVHSTNAAGGLSGLKLEVVKADGGFYELRDTRGSNDVLYRATDPRALASHAMSNGAHSVAHNYDCSAIKD